MLIVLIIDTYPINSLGIANYLQDHLEESTIISVPTLVQFLGRKDFYIPDLIIYGINQQDLKGNLSMIKELREKLSGARLIIYDRSVESQDCLTFFEAGVDGYLGKYAEFNDMLDCISSVMDGKKYMDSQLLIRLVNHKESPPAMPAVKTKLTRREMEIASYLIEGKSTSWISNEIGRFPSTISSFKAKIFTKMKVDNVIDLRKKIMQGK